MKSSINRVTFASAFGTLFEWYDFLIFGLAIVVVFTKLFFLNLDPAAAFGGGVAPVLATWLASLYGLPGIAVLMIVLGCVTLISAYHASETSGKQLS